jgi:hypothetical protein
MRSMVVLLVAGLAVPARAQQPAFEDLDEGASPVDTYERNALGIVRHEIAGGYPCLFGCTTDGWRPVRGKYRRGLGYDAFFRALGRRDLARQHREQRLVSGIFFWGGAAVFAGGAVLLFTGPAPGRLPDAGQGGGGPDAGRAARERRRRRHPARRCSPRRPPWPWRPSTTAGCASTWGWGSTPWP